MSAVTTLLPSFLSTLTPPDDDDNAAGLNEEDRGLAATALTAAAAVLEKDCGAAAAASHMLLLHSHWLRPHSCLPMTMTTPLARIKKIVVRLLSRCHGLVD